MIDAGKAIEMRSKGLSYGDIAKYFDCSRQAVQQRLKGFAELVNPDIIHTHESLQDQILTGAMHKVLENALDNDKLKSMSTLQGVTSYGILFDKQRLLRGQATSISIGYDLTSDEREKLARLETMILAHDASTPAPAPGQVAEFIKEIDKDLT